MDKEKVYLLIKKKAVIDTNYKITIKDIGDVYCSDQNLKTKIENINLYKTDEEDWMSMSSIFIIERLLERHPNLEIDIIGESETLIEIKSKSSENKVLEYIKIILIIIVLFFGAGMAITNFHTDVDMDQTMEKIYTSLTGKKNPNPLILTIPYSIGLGLGVITFFNRIITKNQRRKKEPGPMEIELFSYDKEMEEYITNSITKSKEK